MVILWPVPSKETPWWEWAQTLVSALSIYSQVDTSMTGAIQEFKGSIPPRPWLKADGSNFSTAAFPALKNLLGGTTLPNLTSAYGAGFVVGIHP